MKQSFGRVLRVAPSFALLSMVGCFIGYLLGVPAQQLGVAVSVPLVILFLITRVLTVVLRSQAAIKRRPDYPGGYVLACASVSFNFLLAIAFACSAGVYQLLGLRNLIVGALIISVIGIVATVVSAMLAVRIAYRITLGTLTAYLIGGVILAAWEMLKLPTEIADRLSLNIG